MNLRQQQFLATQRQAHDKDDKIALWIAMEKFRRGLSS